MKVCVKQSLLMLSLLVSLPAKAVVSPGQNMWGIVQQTADTVDQMSETVSIMDDTINTLGGGCTTTPITTGTTITVSGSYCLANNITDSIIIDANSVTLDLNGYTISPPTTGISILTGHQNIWIKNGFIVGGITAIVVATNNKDFIISDIEMAEIAGLGISMSATDTFSDKTEKFTIKNCSMRSCGAGIAAVRCINGVIQNCVGEVVGGNTYLLNACVNIMFENCIAQKSGSHGFFFSNAANCLAYQCKAIDGVSRGFNLTNCTNCQFMGCVAMENLVGFDLTSGNNNLFFNNCATNNVTNYSIGATPDAPLTSSTDATMSYWKNYQAP